MDGSESTNPEHDGASLNGRACPLGGNLLIVEPEALLRWSLTTYLGKWFHVFPAEARAPADEILRGHSIDAAIVSDDLVDQDADELEAAVRSSRSSACLIRTVSHPPPTSPGKHTTIHLEKPFELARLASFLGIRDAGTK